MPTLARTSEINTYPVIEGLDYDFVVFPGLDHTLHVQFLIIHCKAGFLGVERAVLSFDSFLLRFPQVGSCFSENGHLRIRTHGCRGWGDQGCWGWGWGALDSEGPSLLSLFKQGPDSKAPGINPVPAESRPRFRGLQQTGGGKLKGIFYSKKNFWGVAFNSECWFWNGSKSSSRCGSLNQLEESKLSPVKENSGNASLIPYHIWASWSRCHSQILKVSEKNDWMLIIPSKNYHNYVIWKKKEHFNCPFKWLWIFFLDTVPKLTHDNFCGSFLKASCNIESETTSKNIWYLLPYNLLVCVELWMKLLPMYKHHTLIIWEILFTEFYNTSKYQHISLHNIKSHSH